MSDNMPEWVKEISERTDQCDSGPWSIYFNGSSDIQVVQTNTAFPITIPIDQCMLPVYKFIAHTRTDIPKLLSALKIAMRALEDAQDTIHGEFFGSKHHPLCIRPSEALEKIRKGEFE